MEIKIDLDMNQIDYDAINKQIQEKIAALDIKDMYNIETKIDNKISNCVKEEIDYSYNKYIERYWNRENPTSEGKRLIEDMSKNEIEKRTKKVIEDIFANDYNEDTIREVMVKIIPNVFASVLFSRMEDTLYIKDYNYREKAYNLVASQIDSAINRMRY